MADLKISPYLRSLALAAFAAFAVTAAQAQTTTPAAQPAQTQTTTQPSAPPPQAQTPAPDAQKPAQAPTATTKRGSDIASHARRTASRIARVSVPEITSASACRGDATHSMP